MSRIDDLIARLAPEGVRHVALSEVAEYSPTRVDSADLDETNFVGVDNLVSDKGGRVDASYPPNTARLTAYEPGDILLGNIRPYLKKVWLATNAGGCSGDVLAVRITREHRESLDPTFLYYLLSSDGFFAYNMQHAKGAKMPRGDKSAILNYRIPVPPLEVQREIVRVLDQFTQLEAELEAELEARRRQYEHYQRALLAVGSSVENAPMGEIASIGTGKTDRKDATADGAFPLYVRSKDVLSSDKWEFDETAIIIPGEGGIGEIFHFAAGKYALHQRAYRVAPHDTRILPKFLYFYLRENFGDYVRQRAVTATVTSLRRSMLTDFPVPLPSLEEQTRVVEALDQLNALVNDISIGLPAELAARRKQYEYYRDKLLTFEEAAA